MLSDSLSYDRPTDVLICVDNPQAATSIGSVLSARGLSVAAISMSGMQSEFEPNGCRVVITHTAMIGQVRNRLKLPIINVEAFIFERQDRSDTGSPKRFDGAAFVARVLSVMSDAEKRAPR